MRKVLADEAGSMLPIFVVFLMAILWLAGSAANFSAIALQSLRLQSQVDQIALSIYESLEYGFGQTSEHQSCSLFELPIKLIGLPATHKICVQSAAR